MRGNRPRAGFTLVEILMVVVILGIIAGIIIPQLGSRDDLKLSAAARGIIADLSYAQSQAITTQTKQFVVFGQTQYSVKKQSGASLQLISHPVNPGNFTVDYASGTLAGIVISECDFDGQLTIGFDELGSPMAYNTTTKAISTLSATGVIRIQSGDLTLSINIEPYTGEMSVSSASGAGGNGS